ncbi:MAG: alpha/beta fold hydrolase [Alphaproteobacteria bacterium]
MKFNFRLLVFLVFFSVSSLSYALEIKTLQMFDSSRDRNIPVVIYQAENESKLPVVIINHGYEVKNTEYSFIADKLASLGYFVVAIQHELKTDKPLARTGNLFERRKPIWEQGVENILFVMDELKKTQINTNLDKVILIGHSNGGDISMMLADTYPKIVAKIISLDSLRYPFPGGIPILRFGAVDTKPDEGVVPITGIDIVYIKDAKHIDLCDRGSELIKDEIQKSIIQFLNR